MAQYQLPCSRLAQVPIHNNCKPCMSCKSCVEFIKENETVNKSIDSIYSMFINLDKKISLVNEENTSLLIEMKFSKKIETKTIIYFKKYLKVNNVYLRTRFPIFKSFAISIEISNVSIIIKGDKVAYATLK